MMEVQIQILVGLMDIVVQVEVVDRMLQSVYVDRFNYIHCVCVVV